MSAQVDYLKVWHTPALSAMWMQWNWTSRGGKEEIKGLKNLSTADENYPK